MAKQYIDYNPYRSNGVKKQQFVEPIQSMEDYQKVIKYLSEQKKVSAMRSVIISA